MNRTPTTSVLVAALAALPLLTPSVALAQRAGHTAGGSTTAAIDPGFKLDAGIGFESGSGDTGFALRVDGEKDLVPLGNQAKLGLVLSFGYLHFSESRTVFVPAQGGGVFESLDASTNVFKLVPAARLTLPLAPKLAAYGDLGLGFYHASWSVDFAGGSVSDSETDFAMRVAAGLRLDFNPQISGLAELNFNPYFGSMPDTWGMLFGLGFRL